MSPWKKTWRTTCLAAFAATAIISSTRTTAAAGADDLVLDVRREVLDLSGKWETLIDHETAEAWVPAAAAKLGVWQSIDVPGMLNPGVLPKDQEGIKCIWARREFTLDSSHASCGVGLRSNDIHFGSVVWINGQKISERVVAGPWVCLVPSGLLKEGVNHILVRATGWGGVPRAKSGFPLAPFGASNSQSWGGKAAGMGHLWFEFYDGAYLKSVLAMPDLKAKKVTLRIRFDAADTLPAEVEIQAEVALAAALGAKPSVAKLTVKPEKGTPVDLDLAVDNPQAWTPETPILYVAKVSVLSGGKPCDAVEFRFGMREVAVVDGRYRLNGQPCWLRGSNMVGEWNWNESQASAPKRYLVDEARLMNLNGFRTHACPPNSEWSDIADEHGMLFLAELPVLFNTWDFKFTPEEWEVWHANVLATAEGWITKLWNHPSIFQWVLSNESGVNNAWESGEYWRFVKTLDPTRPAMRACGGGGTPETLDIHTCSNTRQGADGWVLEKVAKDAATRDPQRTLSNSEYMNSGSRKHALRWLGDAQLVAEADLVYAQLCAEHTEAMRRLKFDLLLPYMYAGWTSFAGAPGARTWRDPYPTPMAASLHSCMAPVLASLDLFNTNYLAGEEVFTPIALINETHEDVDATIDLYVTSIDPEFLPDPAALRTAVSRETRKRTLKADSIATETVRWTVPARPGVYYLAAVVTRPSDRPVVSQRHLRAIADPVPAARLKGVKLILLGANPAATKWFKDAGADVTDALDKDQPAATVAVWDVAQVTAEQRASAPAILDYVRAGGRVVILEQTRWDWPELVALKYTTFFSRDLGGTSRVFPSQGMEQHPLLAGVLLESLKRWNGLPGAVAESYVDTPGQQDAQPILWAEEPRRAVALEIPFGKGHILACQLAAKHRLEGTSFDPAAVQVMLNLLAPAN